MAGAEFESLIAEAQSHPVRGWDFSWLGSRRFTSPPPWDYDSLVLRRARLAPDMLDLGTGGGEWLAALPFRPRRTVATEAWQPNVAVAQARLRPLGVAVVQVEGAPDNQEQPPDGKRGRLPFAAESFHLVTCRHEAFVAREIARILVAGGLFVTQQVGTITTASTASSTCRHRDGPGTGPWSWRSSRLRPAGSACWRHEGVRKRSRSQTSARWSGTSERFRGRCRGSGRASTSVGCATSTIA
jgi:SAM-dependent methyltransferase